MLAIKHTSTQAHNCNNTTVASVIALCYNASTLLNNTTRDYTMQALCADYSKGLNDAEVEALFEDYDALVERFEREFADYLRGCDSDNVGGVVLYLRGGEEVAFFDYENAHGSIYELGNKYASEVNGQWKERVGAQ
jgi:hypothetical protein